MPETLDINEILRLNPHLDPEDLERIAAGLREAQQMGVLQKGYDLVPPFGGRRLKVAEDEYPDPRAVRLKRSNRMA